MASSTQRESPYQGLTPYEAHDAAYFFGRERETRLIAADLFAASLTLLYGASGVGKSSVLRAGVVPLLQARDDLLVVVFNEWQTEPLTRLTQAVAHAISATRGMSRKDQATLRRTASQPLDEFLTTCATLGKRRLMIILDQFEEYSVYHPSDEAFAVQFPRAATLGDLSVSFLLSLREEAVARLDRFESRIPTLFNNYRRIDHLERAAARTAIERPLERYKQEQMGANIPTAIEPELVEAVLDQVGTGKIQVGQTGHGILDPGTKAPGKERIEAPYLQLVMTRLWNEEWSAGSPRLRWTTLHRLGGAQQIVQTHLEAVMAKLSTEEQDIAARVFHLLVTPSGSKIAHSVRDLADYAAVDREALLRVLNTLARGSDRILRGVAALPEQPAEPRFEIFHDRLAPAILDWRTRFVQRQALTRARRQEVEHRRMEQADTLYSVEQPQHRPRPPSQPMRSIPYPLIGSLLGRGRVFVVIGAGVSISERPIDVPWQPDAPFLPTSSELMRLLAVESGFPNEELDVSNLSQVASYYAAVVGHQLLNEHLHVIFSRPYQPTATHRCLARVAASTPLLIVTTTYDTLMEQAFAEIGLPYDVIMNVPDAGWGSDAPLWFPHDASEPQSIHPAEFSPTKDVSLIYKVFGSVSRTDPRWDNYILTEEDSMALFGRVITQRVIPQVIQAELAHQHALFLGVGLRGWTERLLFRTLRAQGLRRDTRGWAVLRYPWPLDVMQWQMLEVEVYDEDVREFTVRLEQVVGSRG